MSDDVTIGHVRGLLHLLADPTSYAKKLQELEEASQVADSKHAKLAQMQDKITNADRVMGEALKLHLGMKDREDAVASRERELASAVTVHSSEMADREAAVSKRERRVAQREADLDEQEAAIAAKAAGK